MRDALISEMKKWLSVKDEVAIDIILAVAISPALPGELPWLFLVGPPGSCKTETLRALTGPHIYAVERLTRAALIPGKPGVPSILPELDGKALIIKDLSSILSMQETLREELLSELRQAYDGYSSAVFGSGQGRREYHSRFAIVAAATEAIELYRPLHATLGERFLSINIQFDYHDSVHAATVNCGLEEAMRQGIRDAAGAFLKWCFSRAPGFSPSDRFNDQLMAMASLVTLLRSHVPRDRFHRVLLEPRPEVGTRVVKQLISVARCLELMNQLDIKTLQRLAVDSMPTRKYKIARHLLKQGALPTRDIAEATQMSLATIRFTCEDMWILGALEREVIPSGFVDEFRYRASPRLTQLWSESGIP